MKSDNIDDTIMKIVRLIESDASVDAPEDSVKWAKDLYRTRAVEPKPSLVSRVLAVLQLDLTLSHGVTGERSAGTSPERQMLFEAGEIAIDIRVADKDKKKILRGQILGEGYARASIAINNAESRHDTRADQNSEFTLPGVVPGIYSLEIAAGDKLITIETLDLTH